MYVYVCMYVFAHTCMHACMHVSMFMLEYSRTIEIVTNISSFRGCGTVTLNAFPNDFGGAPGMPKAPETLNPKP